MCTCSMLCSSVSSPFRWPCDSPKCPCVPRQRCPPHLSPWAPFSQSRLLGRLVVVNSVPATLSQPRDIALRSVLGLWLGRSCCCGPQEHRITLPHPPAHPTMRAPLCSHGLSSISFPQGGYLFLACLPLPSDLSSADFIIYWYFLGLSPSLPAPTSLCP